MSKRTIATVCTGIDGVGVGARDAGLELAWGIEIDPRLAEVANFNLGDHVKVANLLDCDPMDFDRVDVLHASPPCPNFSVAKTGGVETALDLALARKVAEFVTVLQPGVFTLENVFAYRNSKSWRLIENALYGAGYWLHIDHVNAADMGVPQTRKRMIVRAVRGGFVPYLPQPKPWNSWYAAIEDLMPTLRKSNFADWQSEFTEKAKGIDVFMITGQNAGNSIGYRRGDEPSFTITASQKADTRFSVNGIVYSMNARCFARIQSFPDWYKLPESFELASKGLGNAVPPLLMKAVYEGLSI